MILLNKDGQVSTNKLGINSKRLATNLAQKNHIFDGDLEKYESYLGVNYPFSARILHDATPKPYYQPEELDLSGFFWSRDGLLGAIYIFEQLKSDPIRQIEYVKKHYPDLFTFFTQLSTALEYEILQSRQSCEITDDRQLLVSNHNQQILTMASEFGNIYVDKR